MNLSDPAFWSRFQFGFTLIITTCFLNSLWGWAGSWCIGNGALLRREMKNTIKPSAFGPRFLDSILPLAW